MPRYTILQIHSSMYYVFEEGRVIYKFATFAQAQHKVEQLEYMDFLKESMNPF